MERIVLALLHDQIQVGAGRPGAGVRVLCRRRLDPSGGLIAGWEDAVRGIWKEYGLPRRRVLLILPSAMTSAGILQLPAMRKGRLARAVRDETRYHAAREVVADCLPIGRERRGVWRVLACSCAREDFQQVIEMTDRLDLKLEAVTVPLEPAIQLMRHTRALRSGPCILIFYDGEALLFLMAERGVCRYAAQRQIPEEEGAERIAAGVTGGVADILQFQAAREENTSLSRVYYASCAGVDFRACVSGLQPFGLAAVPLPRCERICSFPPEERMSDWLLCAGGMLR